MPLRAVLFNTPALKGHHGCTLVRKQIHELAHAAGIKIIAELPLASDWSATGPQDFDLAIVNGEGSLHHDFKAAIQIAKIPSWCAKRNRPAFLINTIYQENSDEVAEGVSGFARIFARDDASAQSLANAGISATTIPDLTLTWQPQIRTPSSGNELIITDSADRTLNRELFDFSIKSDAHFLPLIAGPIPVSGTSDKNYQLRVATYQLRRLVAAITPPVGPAALWRARYTKLIPEFDSFAAYLANNASVVVAGRFHSTCIALCLECPLLALKLSTWKTETLLTAVGLESRLCADIKEVERRLEEVKPEELDYTNEELNNIRAFRCDVRKKANEMFSHIAADVAAGRVKQQ